MRNSNMPSMDEIRAFSGRLCTELGFEILGESRGSRVAVVGPKGKRLAIKDGD
jgi:wyosine [tRNA(Phe)-imidazoG37] synthetase (radical SAM superfamily)